MRISDWSSDVCSSDLIEDVARIGFAARRSAEQQRHLAIGDRLLRQIVIDNDGVHAVVAEKLAHGAAGIGREELERSRFRCGGGNDDRIFHRSEEHTSELQSLMRISYAVFCLKKKTKKSQTNINKKSDGVDK